MMKILLLSLLTVSQVFALGQQVTLLQNQPIYIEYFNSNNAGKSIYLTVLEIQSKKKASVELTPSSEDKRMLNGYFRIQMDMQKLASQNLEFLTKSGNKLFAHVIPNTNSQEKALSVVLFNKESEWQEYTVQFLNKAREELQKQQDKIQLEDKKNSKLTANANNETKAIFKEKKETLVRLNDRIQEQTRLSFEVQEALKREELLKKQELKTKEEKEKNKKLATEKSNQAYVAYQNQNFKEAVRLYEEASSLDPENDMFYYQYAVSLYKINNYNKSLSILSMAEGGEQNIYEHRYYVALNHLKLNEVDKALGYFKDLKEDNDKDLSPISAFYAGNIEMKQNKFKEAREDFQYVLDKSSDPSIDKEAELKIEEIDRLENFLESQKEIFKYSLFFGPQYDGNVLNISTQNLATNSEAIRFQYGGSFTYNAYRTMKSLYSLQFDISDMYSFDKNFKSDSTIQSADPLQTGLKLPMSHQWGLFGKDFSSNFIPYYSLLSMSNDGGSRKQIMSSTGASFDLSWSSSKKWIHITKLDYVSDNSTLEVTSDDDKQSATRSTVGYSLIRLLDDKGVKSIVGDFNYISNSSVGKNNNFNKSILGLSYNFPWTKIYKGSSRLEYTDLKYPDNSNLRKDSIIVASLIASKDLSKNKNVSMNFAYTVNSSNVDSYKYNKYLLGFLYTYSGNYLRK